MSNATKANVTQTVNHQMKFSNGTNGAWASKTNGFWDFGALKSGSRFVEVDGDVLAVVQGNGAADKNEEDAAYDIFTNMEPGYKYTITLDIINKVVAIEKGEALPYAFVVKSKSLIEKGVTVTFAHNSTETVVWTTSDATVATVTDGKVTGVTTGAVKITASTTVGGVGFTKEMTVIVTEVGASTATNYQLVGSLTNPTWTPSNPNYNIGSGLTIPVSAGTHNWRFVKDGSWDTNYTLNLTSTNTTLVKAGDVISGTVTAGTEGNLTTVFPAGTFKFEFDATAGTFKVTAVTVDATVE